MQSAVAALAARHPATTSDKTGGVEPYFPPGARLRSQVVVRAVDAARPLRHRAARRRPEHLGHDAGPQRDARARAGDPAGDGREPLAPDAVSPERSAGHGHPRRQPGVGAAVRRAGRRGLGVQLLRDRRSICSRPIRGWCSSASRCASSPAWCWALLPALRFSRPAIISALKNDSAGGGRRVGRLQRLHRGGAGRPRRSVPRHLRRVSRSGARDRLRRRRFHAAGPLCGAPESRRDRQDGRGAAAVRADGAGEPGAGARRRVGERRRRRAARLHLSQRARRARAATATSSPRTRRASARTTWTRSAPACSPAASIDANDRDGAERVVLLSEPLARQLFPPAIRSAGASSLRWPAASGRPTPSSA